MVRVFPKSASQLNFNNIIIWFSVFVLTDERLETDNLTIDNFTEIFALPIQMEIDSNPGMK